MRGPPTGSWTTNTTYAGFMRRVGDTLETFIQVETAGAPDAVALTINLPTGLVADTAKFAGSNPVVGRGWTSDSGNSRGYALVRLASGIFACLHSSTGPSTMTAISSTVPITWGANDKLELMTFSLPIQGW